MSWSKLIIFIGILITFSCNSKVDFYQKISKDFNVDTSKDILLIVYKPLECLNCNIGVYHMFNDSNINLKFGENIYFMYNGIRDIELADYQNNFKETLGIDAKMINNSKLYNEIFQQVNIDAKRLKPTCVVLYKNGNPPKVENMKDPNILNLLCQ